MPSSRGSSRSRGQTCVSCGSFIAGGFFTAQPPGKPTYVSTTYQLSPFLYFSCIYKLIIYLLTYLSSVYAGFKLCCRRLVASCLALVRVQNRGVWRLCCSVGSPRVPAAAHTAPSMCWVICPQEIEAVTSPCPLSSQTVSSFPSPPDEGWRITLKSVWSKDLRDGRGTTPFQRQFCRGAASLFWTQVHCNFPAEWHCLNYSCGTVFLPANGDNNVP